MTTTDAFLRAIIAEPDSDAPRLVFADRLEEQGDVARSEFIRVQCRLVSEFGIPTDGRPVVTGDKAADAEEVTLRRRERALLYQHKTAWLNPWKDGDWHGITNWDEAPCLTLHLKPEWTNMDVVFRRSFVDEVRCTLRAWTGGPCRQCNGAGRRAWREGDAFIGGQCLCHGTNVALGIGPAVVACQPVTKVVASDRKPSWRFDGTGERRWHWSLANKDATLLDVLEFSPSLLPWSVYWALPGALGAYTTEYPTNEAALAALSAALLTHAKKGAPC